LVANVQVNVIFSIKKAEIYTSTTVFVETPLIKVPFSIPAICCTYGSSNGCYKKEYK